MTDLEFDAAFEAAWSALLEPAIEPEPITARRPVDVHEADTLPAIEAARRSA